jgi:hypothetical protein
MHRERVEWRISRTKRVEEASSIYCPKCGMWNRPGAENCSVCMRALQRAGWRRLGPLYLLEEIFESLAGYWKRFTDVIYDLWERLTGFNGRGGCGGQR